MDIFIYVVIDKRVFMTSSGKIFEQLLNDASLLQILPKILDTIFYIGYLVFLCIFTMYLTKFLLLVVTYLSSF